MCWHGVCLWWMPRLLSCGILPWALLIDALLCYIILFPALLCCANMDQPIDYGWQGTVWADRCLGQSCWAGLVLTGGLGWMDPCFRACHGGGPESRLEPGSETVMRGTMCQDWRSSHTTRHHRLSIITQLLLTSPDLLFPFFCLSDTSQPSTKHIFPLHFLFLVILLCSTLHLFQPAIWSLSLSLSFLPFIHTLTGQTLSLQARGIVCVCACMWVCGLWCVFVVADAPPAIQREFKILFPAWV